MFRIKVKSCSFYRFKTLKQWCRDDQHIHDRRSRQQKDNAMLRREELPKSTNSEKEERAKTLIKPDCSFSVFYCCIVSQLPICYV